MKTVTIVCDLCDGPIVNYTEYPGVGKYQTYKLFSADVCEECCTKLQNSAVFRELLLSLRKKEA